MDYFITYLDQINKISCKFRDQKKTFNNTSKIIFRMKIEESIFCFFLLILTCTLILVYVLKTRLDEILQKKVILCINRFFNELDVSKNKYSIQFT